jgi:hypothetical protein
LRKLVLLLANHEKVPHRVVEDHHHIGLIVQCRQNFSKAVIVGMRREFFECRHPLLRLGAGQVVNAQMEILYSAVGGAPFYRNRNLPRAGNGTQQHGCLDVVVIGDGDHRSKAEFLDLRTLQVKGELGGQRRCPVCSRIVDADAMIEFRPAFQAGQQRPKHGMLAADIGEETQRFLGLVGVTMQRDPGAKSACRALVTPQVRDGRVGHSSPF